MKGRSVPVSQRTENRMAAGENRSGVKLRRVLTLGDLVIYGIVLIQPVAALPLFGHANAVSRGHAVTTVLFAMCAMILTAVSYGRMAGRYPAAGSAYTYVGRALDPRLGFIAGWCMFMDYLLIPILCVIYTSVTAGHLLPFIPYPVWILLFTGGFTLLNLNGIKSASRANWAMMAVMSAVVFWFMAAAVRYVWGVRGPGGLASLKPFYDQASFSWPAIRSGTALAALTFIGFDGLTTLSEEVHNPRRNVLLAAVLTCLITGIWSGAQVYLAQISWPDWASFTRGAAGEAARTRALDTAIMAVAKRIGGGGLDAGLSLVLLVGSIGSGVTGQIGAARLLYGMGRDRVLPRKFFAHLDVKHAAPSRNVLFIGALTLIGAAALNYEESARLINFGAFLAFIGVNLACIREYYFKGPRTIRSFLLNFLTPAVGAAVCLVIWKSLPLKTFIVGGLWMTAGIVYLLIRTSGFRKPMVMTDFSDRGREERPGGEQGMP
jgi:putrescine importer